MNASTLRGGTATISKNQGARTVRVFVGLVFGLCLASTTFSNTIQANELDIGLQVRTIFAANCSGCHTRGSNSLAGVKYRGDLDAILDFEKLRAGPYLDLTHPESSELYELVSDGSMPHEKAVQAGLVSVLSKQELAIVLDWIRAGAPDSLTGPGEESNVEPDVDWSRGRQIFQAACSACHPASRALGKNKTFDAWLNTVERMAQKTGAHIRSSDFEEIAGYLANRPDSATSTQNQVASSTGSIADYLSAHGTLSTTWLGSGRDDRLENPDFTFEAWLSLDWRPEASALSARVTACTTCHSSQEPEGRALELTEAVLRFDLTKEFGHGQTKVNSYVEAGRFIVPFGAFSGQSNPAAYRTVTRPLLYNMGQMVDRNRIGPAVLPMPYSDEGVRVNLAAPISSDLSLDFDVYAVNGLQGSTGVDFFNSRSYTDNNSDLAVGGRLVASTANISVGASGMAGRLDSSSGSFGKLDYSVVGLDLNARVGSRIRLLAEVARREHDQATFVPANPRTRIRTEGMLLETNVLLSAEREVSLIARYDTLHYTGAVPPQMSSLSGDFHARRFTWGFEFGLSGGSTLMLNHEHWSMPDDMESVDVVGVRWVTSF